MPLLPASASISTAATRPAPSASMTSATASAARLPQSSGVVLPKGQR